MSPHRPSRRATLDRTGALVRDPLVRNSLVLALNTGFAALFGLLFWTVAARVYTTSGVGLVASVTSLAPLLATVAGLGLTELVIRHYATHLDQRGLLRRSLTASVTAATLLAVLWWVVARRSTPLDSFGFDVPLVAVLVVLLVSSVVDNLTASAFVAARRPHLLLTVTLVVGAARLGFVTLLSSRGTEGLLLATVAGVALSATFSVVLLYFLVRPGRGLTEPFARTQYLFALSNWLAATLSWVPRGLAVSIIAWRAGVEEAAWVALPLLTLPLLTLLPRVVARSFYAEAAASPHRFGSLLRRSSAVSLVSTLGVCALAALAAPVFLGILGTGYANESTTLLRLLALAAVVSVPNYLVDVSLNLRGDHRGFLIVNATSVTLLLGSLVWLSSWGPAGVGIAWVVGQAGNAAVGVGVFWYRHRRDVPTLAGPPEQASDTDTGFTGPV